MIARDTLSRSIGNLPLSPVNIALHARFENFTVGDCLDTFGLFEDILSHMTRVVSGLRDKADYANNERGKTDDQRAVARYGFLQAADVILPLLQTQLEAMTMTARTMSMALGETDISIELVPGERKRSE